jgi:integrase
MGVRELFNRYLAAQERKRDAGKIGSRALADSAGTLKRVLAILNDRLTSTLAAEDFDRLGQRLAKGRSAVTVAGDVRRTKAAFNWAHKAGLIAKLPSYGADFEAPPVRIIRLAKSQRGAMMFSATELRTLITTAPVHLKAMILLGANCALLPIDLARLTFEEIDSDFAWLRQARHKTGVDRLAALWPETAKALRASIAERTKPGNKAYTDLVFLTESGLPVVRTRTPAKAAKDPKAALNQTVINRVTSDFRDLQKTVGVYRHGRGFNSLRHGFLTVAEASRDFPAVAKVMGHSVPGVSSHYREHIGDDRIKAACEVVRAWLRSGAEGELL